MMMSPRRYPSPSPNPNPNFNPNPNPNPNPNALQGEKKGGSLVDLPDVHVYQLTDLASSLSANSAGAREYAHWIATTNESADPYTHLNTRSKVNGANANIDAASDESSTSSADAAYLTATGT